MPAFLVPFMFVLDPAGQGLLLMGSVKALATADWGSIALLTFTAAAAIAALGAGFQGWGLTKTTPIERLLFVIAGFALVLPGTTSRTVGFGCAIAALVIQWLRRARATT